MIDDFIEDVNVIPVLKVFIVVSLFGVNVVLVEVIVFKGVFVGLLKSVVVSVETDTTGVVGFVNFLIVVRA